MVSDQIVTRSYSNQEHEGQHTMRKYETDERTAFVWATRMHQSETRGSPASGFVIETRGQLVVWATTRHRAPATAMQMSCHVTIQFTNAPQEDTDLLPSIWAHAVRDRVRMLKERYANMTTHMIREISTEEQLRRRLPRNSDLCSP